jgi:hypothetical protein
VSAALFASGAYRVGIRDTALRVMAKPLAGEGFAEYLSRVARDRPESP